MYNLAQPIMHMTPAAALAASLTSPGKTWHDENGARSCTPYVVSCPDIFAAHAPIEKLHLRPPRSAACASLPLHIRVILAMICQRLFDSSLNVKTLRTACQISDHNISTEFKRHFGYSIREYIEFHRLKMAASILTSLELPVNEVAFAVGYSHIQTFHRAFVRQFRCTPGAYRAEQDRELAPASSWACGRALTETVRDRSELGLS